MALKLSGFFQTNVSDMHRGEAVSQSHAKAGNDKAMQAETPAKELIPGRAVRGEVVGKNGQEIQIRIAKDVIINARMEQDIQASAGQNITFEVRSNTAGVISLRPLFQNMSQESNALKALVQAGIESDAKSMQMVSAMMQEGMSIGKEALQGMYKTISGVQESDITNAVQMSRLQIPVTPENLQQFGAYKNYEHQLISAFSEVADQIPETVSQLFSDGASQEGNSLIGKILTTFAANSDGKEVVLAGNAVRNVAISQENIVTNGMSTESPLPDFVVPDETISVNEKIVPDGNIGDAASTEEMKNTFTEREVLLTTDSVPEEAFVKDSSQRTGESVEMHFEKELIPQEREQLANLVREAGGSPEKAVQILNGQIGKEDIYQLVRTLSENADTPKLQNAVKELFVSEGFQKIFKEKVENQWTLNAPERLEKEEISKLYERLNEQTKQLTQALSETVKADSPIFRSVQNIRENVEFMNQLNQMYSYVQLPLKLGENSAHGELYVYTNKKNLAKHDGNISAFLHLDMEHLGTVDVYVAMEQSRISTNFYLEDEESLLLLEKNMELLTKRLTDKGYLAEAKLTLRDEPGNVMEEIVKTDKNISIISEQSFDVRA